MPESEVTELNPTDFLGLIIAEMRAELEEDGFTVQNAVGELARDGHWVSTNYAGGEFEVTTWKGRSGTRHKVRITNLLVAKHPGYWAELTEFIAAGNVNWRGVGSKYEVI